MSSYQEKLIEARQTDLSNKAFLSDAEGSVYLSLGRTAFMQFAKKIGCRKKVGNRVVNDREIIDRALKRGEAL